jgi:branched-chain amino acid transport system ATP-binding protein
VDGLSLEVNRREIVALIGPNGAGKTTAFNCVTGVYEPTGGVISFLGKAIAKGASPDRITKLGIARTFQNIRLFNTMTVLENVLVAKHMRARHNVFTAALRISGKEESASGRKRLRCWRSRGLGI